MSEKNQRTPTEYIVTREQARYIAKRRMKEAGIKNFNRHSYSSITTKTGFVSQTIIPSYFAEHWKEYIHEKKEA